jgi:cytohesin
MILISVAAFATFRVEGQEAPFIVKPPQPAADGTPLPPNLAFISPAGDMEITDRLIDLQIQAAGLHPIARIELTVNGKPCLPQMAKAMTFDKPDKLQLAVNLPYRLPLDETRFHLRAVAYDTEGMRSAPAEVTLYLPGAGEAAERLFVLCVGIYQFKTLGITGQRFAARDAEAIAKLYTERRIQPPCSKDVTVRLLTDADATAANITAALNEIKANAGPKDMVIIYLATHRFRDAGGNLHLAAYDLNPADLRQTGVNWRTLTGLIDSLATPQVLVLADIGRSAENPTARTLDAQLRAFYSVKPDELPVSQGDWGHGAFALAVMEGLGGKADAGEANGAITFSELNDYVTKRVEMLSEGSQHPQWPNFNAKLKDAPLTMTSLPSLDAMTAAELTELLQAGEAEVKRRDNTGRTLLHRATAVNRAELVEMLLARGAEVNAADATGITPLHIAAASGMPEVAGKLLARGADLTARDRQGHSPFDTARIYEQAVMMDFFLPAAMPDSRDEQGNTPLHLAVFYARPKVVQQMLARGVNLETANNDGHTPLHLAAANGQVEIAGLLLDKGASHRAANAAGATPLHLAVARNQAKMASFLLDRRVDANAKDKNGRTPLFLTVESENLAMIDLLAARGARLDLGDKDGLTALHLAITGGKLTVARQLLLRKADANVRDNSQYAPLHWAATQESPEMLKLLLEFKPSLNPHDKDGFTPLHAAAWYNRTENITRLLAAGALLNDKSRDGFTPLAIAKKNNANEAAELLKQKGGFE